MGAPSKRAKKVRRTAEFDLTRLAAQLRPPKQNRGAYAWTLDSIRSARDAQLLGNFRLPSLLATSMRTDDAVFVAYQNRLAPQRGLPVELTPANTSARAKRVGDEGQALFGPEGVGVSTETLANINGDLANHNVAFAVNVLTPREDGSRVDFEVHYWPIEFVRWDPIQRCYMTQIEPGTGHDADLLCGRAEVPIVHGDGRWIIFQKEEHEPWKHEAAVLCALNWATHAHATRDWSNTSASHGNVKVIGELPEGVALTGPDGGPTAEAQALITMLSDVLTDESGVGIRPAGSKTDVLTNGSTAWQVFERLAVHSGLAWSRIYLGTDGVVGSNPTGPGVDMRAMFGVRNDIVEGDLKAITQGLATGTIEIWAAINFGDSTLAPGRKYLLPDADEDARRESLATRQSAFFADLEAAKRLGFDVSQDYVNELAAAYGVTAPTLKASDPNAPAGGTVPGPQSAPAATVSPPLRRLARP